MMQIGRWKLPRRYTRCKTKQYRETSGCRSICLDNRAARAIGDDAKTPRKLSKVDCLSLMDLRFVIARGCAVAGDDKHWVITEIANSFRKQRMD